jgi:hypothetical protein
VKLLQERLHTLQRLLIDRLPLALF